MSPLKRPALIATTLASSVLLLGCQSADAPEAVPSEPAPTTTAPAEGATAEANRTPEAEPQAAEPTSEEEAPEEHSGHTEDEAIAAIEDVMGEEACESQEVPAGTPLEQWSIDEYFIDESGEHGALKGSLTRIWCVPTPGADPVAAPDHLTLRFFTHQDDLDSDNYQLGLSAMEQDDLHIYWNKDEDWTAATWGATPDTWVLMEDLGATNMSFSDHAYEDGEP